MARGKKAAKELTAEEKLEQALVPVDEQPYPVPENWCWTSLKNIAEIIMGQSPTGTSMTDDSSYIPLIGGASDMGDLYPKATRYTKRPTKISNKDDLILCIRATLGRPIFSDGEYCLGRGVAGIRPYQGKKEFIRLFFLNFERYLYENATGTTFAQVSRNVLENMPVPFPPVTEQQRIVDHIESIFAKLDEAKEKAQAVVDGFELRKSTILHKAFTGELTEKWRAEYGVAMDSWRRTAFENIAIAIDPQPSHRTPPISADGIPYVGIAECNYDTNEIDFVSARKVGKNVLNEHLERYSLHEGDFIIGKIGTVGKPFFIPSLQNYTLSANVILIQPKRECIKSSFLFYQFQSGQINLQFKEGIKATTQVAFGIQKVRKMRIILPNINEQQVIVNILDNILAKEQHAKEVAEAVIDQIDTMKRAVLARAFRGELGTNDPEDESAVELLKSILC